MSGYIGTQPVPQATQTRQTFVATAAQTSFATGGYSVGYLDVFLNGVKLQDGVDYTATNGSDIVLTVGAALDDTLEVVAYTAFEVLNQTFTGTTTTEGLTVTGAFTSKGIDDNATSTAITIDSIENVGIGTASPDSKVSLQVPSANTVAIKGINAATGASGTGAFRVGTGEASQSRSFIDFTQSWTGTYNDYDIRFTTTKGGVGGAERMRIDSSGRVGIGTSSPRSPLEVVGDIELSGGIFLGGRAAANYLDDYEEGLWTPTVVGSSTAGVGVYNNYRNGHYTKVGNLVSVSFIVGLNSHSGSGSMMLQGLPFALTSTFNNYFSAVTFGEYTMGVPAGTQLTATVFFGGAYIAFQYVTNGSSNSVVNQLPLDPSFSYLIGSLTYRTDA